MSYCKTAITNMFMSRPVGIMLLQIPSLFYAEFLLKFYQYAHIYSFYASDFIIIPH